MGQRSGVEAGLWETESAKKIKIQQCRVEEMEAF